jgi:hypothetical protein
VLTALVRRASKDRHKYLRPSFETRAEGAPSG